MNLSKDQKRYNVVMLDGGAIGYDFEWPCFIDFGSFMRHDYSQPAEVSKRINDAEIVLTNKVEISAEHIDNAPNLKYIGCLATGYNHVDVKAAAERGIVVTNVPDYSSTAVAQHVLALMLEFTNRVGMHDKAVHEGEWANSKYFCFWKKPIIELADKTLGIIGYGNIGRRVAHLASAFGMNILAHSPSKKEHPGYPDFEFASLDDIFAKSDFISLHSPLTPETQHMVNKERLRQMKQGAYIINTARGPLIDEDALANALKSGQIAGAGLDVVSVEPILKSNLLLATPNVYITPHIGWASVEARSRLMKGVYANIRAFQTGQPVNVVNRLK